MNIIKQLDILQEAVETGYMFQQLIISNCEVGTLATWYTSRGDVHLQVTKTSYSAG